MYFLKNDETGGGGDNRLHLQEQKFFDTPNSQTWDCRRTLADVKLQE